MSENVDSDLFLLAFSFHLLGSLSYAFSYNYHQLNDFRGKSDKSNYDIGLVIQ